MELWEKFMQTGKIADYLEYKRSSEENENDNGKISHHKGRAERGDQ